MRPNIGAGRFRIQVDRLVGVTIRDHAGEPYAALTSASTIFYDAGMLPTVEDEHLGDAIDDATMPGTRYFRHFNDSSRQLVEPAFLELGLDKRVQRHATAAIGRADVPFRNRAGGGGHGNTSCRVVKSSIQFIGRGRSHQP